MSGAGSRRFTALPVPEKCAKSDGHDFACGAGGNRHGGGIGGVKYDRASTLAWSLDGDPASSVLAWDVRKVKAGHAMDDEVRAWTGAELAEHEKWAKRAPHSDDARWLETVRQLNAKLDRLRLQKEELIDSDARQVEEIARLRATPGGRLVEAAQRVVGARRASVECDAAIDALESALAALPEADAGKCQTCDGHGFYMVNAHGPNEVKCDDCDGSGDRKADPAPIPMILHCPECRARHVDEGEFATKVHHTHSCQSCGLSWRPAVVPTVGVRFLPGFKNDAAMFESIGNEVQDRPAPDTITAPELTRIASTLTEADDLPDIGRANTMLSGPDAEKDVRAVLAEAKAALEACVGQKGDFPSPDPRAGLRILGAGESDPEASSELEVSASRAADALEKRARAAAKAIGEVITECPAQLAASDPNCPYDGGACSVHTRDNLAAARSEHPQTRDARDMGACALTFHVLHEALLAGGYSASRIVERLREVGIAASVTHLHHVGLQDVANALCGEVLEVLSDEAHSPAALSSAEVRDLQARLVQAEESADRYSGDAREAEAQLAREREAVDGLIAILEDDDRDCDAWKLVLASIEAVRKSREGAGSSPPDERLGWAAEIRARASPCLELRGLELHDSGEQTVGPRVVAVPDCEGWWILRAESGPAEHVAVERDLMEIRRNVDTDKLVVWNGGDWYALTEIDPSDRERWVGPLPEGWT